MNVKHNRSTYINKGCRCRFCIAANSLYATTLREQRAAKGLAADDPRHGKPDTYRNWGCRCEACTDAQRVRQRQYRASKRGQQ